MLRSKVCQGVECVKEQIELGSKAYQSLPPYAISTFLFLDSPKPDTL